MDRLRPIGHVTAPAPLECIAAQGDPFDAQIRTKGDIKADYMPLLATGLSGLSASEVLSSCYNNNNFTPAIYMGALATLLPLFIYSGVRDATSYNKYKNALSTQSLARESDAAAANCDLLRNKHGGLSIRSFAFDGKTPDGSTPKSLMSLYELAKKHDVKQVVLGYDSLKELLSSRSDVSFGHEIPSDMLFSVIKGKNAKNHTLEDKSADTTLLCTNTKNLPACALAVCEALGIDLASDLIAKISSPRLQGAFETYQEDHDKIALRSAVGQEIQTALSADTDYDQLPVRTGGRNYNRILHIEPVLQGNDVVTYSRPSGRVIDRGFDHGTSGSVAAAVQEHIPAPTTEPLARHLGFQDGGELIATALDETPATDDGDAEPRLLAALYLYLGDDRPDMQQSVLPMIDDVRPSIDTTFQRMADSADKTVQIYDGKYTHKVVRRVAAALMAIVAPGLIIYGANHYVTSEFEGYRAESVEAWKASHPGEDVPIEIKNMRISRLGETSDPFDLKRTEAYRGFLGTTSGNAVLALAATANDVAETTYNVTNKLTNDLINSLLKKEHGSSLLPYEYSKVNEGSMTGDSLAAKETAFTYTMLSGETAPEYWMNTWYDTAFFEGGMVSYANNHPVFIMQPMLYDTIEQVEQNNPDIVVETATARNSFGSFFLPVPQGYSIEAAFSISESSGQQQPLTLYKNTISEATYANDTELGKDVPGQSKIKYYLKKSNLPFVNTSAATEWFDLNAGRYETPEDTAAYKEAIREVLHDYYDLPPDATLEQIGARIQEQPYSYTPFKDSGLTGLYDIYNTPTLLDRQKSALVAATELDAHNCNTANTTAGLLTNFDKDDVSDRNNEAIVSGFREQDNDGKLMFPGHMFGVKDGKIVDFTPSLGTSSGQTGAGTTATVAPAFAFNSSELMIAGGSVAILVGGVIALRRRRQIRQAIDSKVTELREGFIDHQEAQAVIDAVSWGPEGMPIPDFRQNPPQGYHRHNAHDPISVRELLKLARQKDMPTDAVSLGALFITETLRLTDGSKRRDTARRTQTKNQ